ncbi:MAG: tyrosine-type recombinase/integrase [Chloroflexota bacterium]
MKTHLEVSDVALLEANAVTFDRRALAWVPCLRDRLLIRLIFRTGCRVGEVLPLAVEDLDLDLGLVKVVKEKDRLQLFCPDCGQRLARAHKFCPGCAHQVTAAEKRVQETRRQRLLPLDPDIVAMLRHYIERGGPVMKDGRLLLFGMSRVLAWRVVSLAAKRAGLGRLVNTETGREHGVSPHRLRDAFATHAVDIDSSTDGIQLLQEHLDHKNIGTTMKYRKLSGEQQKDWYGKLWRKGEQHG